ncbi:hypothetical protein FQR65_LT04446 [Abscondita terminalis]|nr:hypothetical protein FQR65_LT04446 [Abscondita terminalis]
MKIAIIGAGPAGLVSLKYSLDSGHECEVFEQSGTLGGTWVYTDRVGTDENGLPIHSSMYQNMRTNLPKEVMYFLDYPYPETKMESYITQSEVLQYFNNYAKEYKLETCIKYYHCVKEVVPRHPFKWQVKVENVKIKEMETKTYDAIFVCNGHYSDPFIPKILGQDLFKGKQMHSHNYRSAEQYKNKRVLLIGAGSSGTDIALKISDVSEYVFLSSNSDFEVSEHFQMKPEIKNFTENDAVFSDNSKEKIDVVMYCTGYLYSYPFLSDECQISVDDNWVQPLYKHIVNVKHPTMFFIGIPFLAPVIPLCDIQVRYCLASLQKTILPSENEMLLELNEYASSKGNIPKRHWHKIGSDKLEEYFQGLSTSANITPVPTVISKIYTRARKQRYLNDCFKITSNESFVQVR